VAHLGQGPHLDQDAVAQDADTVAQRFDLAQDVRREKDGLATLVGLVDADTEGLLHEGIEPGGRLVEDEQVGPGHEGGDELELLAVALRVGPDLLGRVEVEAGDELVR